MELESDLLSVLRDSLSLLELEVSEEHSDKLFKYAQLVHKWSKVYNLTAVRSLESIIKRHILDSLTITKYIENNTRVIDVGSGAGFPGIPLSIVRDDIVVALAECNGRKTSFLRQVISDLGLINVGVVNARIEDFVPKKPFDVVVSRAFSSLHNIIEASKPVLNKSGYILAMKGMYPSAELDEIDYPYEVFDLNMLGDEVQRHLVLVEAKSFLKESV